MKKQQFLRRVLAMALSLLLTLGCLSGCTGEQETKPQPTEPEQATAPVTESTQPGLRYEPVEPVQLQELEEREKMQRASSRGPGDTVHKDYTILVYMVGSNLESEGGAATADLSEMLGSAMDPEKANVVIYTGGSKAWQCNIPSSVNAIWSLNSTMTDLQPEAATQSPVNTGNPATLAEFLNFGYENFPADHYGVIFWDHGGGPLGGFGSDELFGGDGLTLDELAGAMEASAFKDKKLDFVGFDACLMASFEVAVMFSDYAHYLIASEELEPGCGWDYSFLEVLNSTTDTKTIARQILSTYEDSLKDNIWRPEYTLSCMDLSKVSEASAAMDALYEKMGQAVIEGHFSSVAKARENTKAFALSAVASRSNALDLVDLGDMAQQLQGQYPQESQGVLNALDALVVDNVTNLEGANGVTVYYPYENKNSFQSEVNYIMQLFPSSDGQRSFMELFCDVWLNGELTLDMSETEAPVKTQEELTFQLTQEQLDNLSAAYYTLFIKGGQEIGEDAYSPVLLDVKIEPDANGVLHIPADPEVFFFKSDMDSDGMVYTVRQVEKTAQKDNYVSVGSVVFSTGDVTSGMEGIQLYAAEDLADGQVQIQNIYSTAYTDAGTYGKMEMDMSHWAFVGRNVFYRYPTYDTNGWLLPYEKWQTSGWTMYEMAPYKEEFWLEKGNVSQLDTQVYCQVMLKDTMGNTYGTALAELENETTYEVVEVSVDGGNLIYYIEGNQGVLAGYSGSFDHLEIPETVEGATEFMIGANAFDGCKLTSVTIPGSVKYIAYSAFSGCMELESVTLQEGIQRIGPYAFFCCGLTQLQLPESLETVEYCAFGYNKLTCVEIPSGVKEIQYGAFANMRTLSEITVAPGNSSYKSVDGVLFTADGKTLVQFPAGGPNAYAVPSGVTVIENKAFSGASDLYQITFNSELEKLGSEAFYSVLNLESITLPDSLKFIGNACFDGLDWSFEEPVNAPAAFVYIGAGVEWIGYNAFDGYGLTAYEVSAENQHYSSVDGLLLNKSGTRLIEVPIGFTGKLELPSYVSSVADGAWDDCDGITELVIPDSVVSIDSACGLLYYLEKITVGAGLVDWGNVDDIGAVAQVQVSPQNPAYTMQDGCIYTKDMKTLLCARTDATELSVPEGVEYIDGYAFGAIVGESCPNVTTLKLPGTLKSFNPGTFGALDALEQFVMDGSGSDYKVVDGMLYSADGTVLWAVPPCFNGGNITVADGTREIGAGAFGSGVKVETVVIPEGVVAVRQGNFSYDYDLWDLEYQQHVYFPDSLTDIYPECFKSLEATVIHCSLGSAVDKFCKDKGIETVSD